MLKYLKLFEQFLHLNEKKPKGAPEFHHSDAPDAEGRFKDLSIKDLAAWLIKTRKKDVKKISGSLTQQIVFNRKSDPKYAEKMEKTRKEVYKQLGREDLLKESINTERSLNKIYIAQPDVWGDSSKSEVFGKPTIKKKFINLISKENINDLNINKDYPIINYKC